MKTDEIQLVLFWLTRRINMKIFNDFEVFKSTGWESSKICYMNVLKILWNPKWGSPDTGYCTLCLYEHWAYMFGWLERLNIVHVLLQTHFTRTLCLSFQILESMLFAVLPLGCRSMSHWTNPGPLLYIYLFIYFPPFQRQRKLWVEGNIGNNKRNRQPNGRIADWIHFLSTMCVYDHLNHTFTR